MATSWSRPLRHSSAFLRASCSASVCSRTATSKLKQSIQRYQQIEPRVAGTRAFTTEVQPSEEAEGIQTLVEPMKSELQATTDGAELQEKADEDDVRLPRSVQAAYLRPLRRKQTYGLPACDLQLRSFSARNVEFFADFALRAAYYLNMPAAGPIPLPKLVERWTVPKSPFVHKKSQENWERKTLRRLIQIKDAHPETVQIWLAFLRKHQFHGVGMKANVWDHDKIMVGETLEANLTDLKPELAKQWALFGREKRSDKDEKILDSMHSDEIRSAIQGTLPPKFPARDT